jgi:hypothetical protein
MRILSYAQRLLERVGMRRRRYRIQRLEELPDIPKPYIVYAIGYPLVWQAALLCPCGCNDLIQLSLLKADSPRWRLTGGNGKPATLHPSVWRTKGCAAHFILRKGGVVWCSSDRS